LTHRVVKYIKLPDAIMIRGHYNAHESITLKLHVSSCPDFRLLSYSY